jgi:NADH-ubiquinone oxidoreductase chain 5
MFYNKYITGLVLKLGGQTTKVLDKGSVELLGPYGLEKGLVTLSRNIASLDTGVITNYALYILIGLIFYILIPYLIIIDNSLLLLILLALLSVIDVYNDKSEKKLTYKYIPSHVLKSDILGSFSNFFFNIYIYFYVQLPYNIECIRSYINNKDNFAKYLLNILLDLGLILLICFPILFFNILSILLYNIKFSFNTLYFLTDY